MEIKLLSLPGLFVGLNVPDGLDGPDGPNGPDGVGTFSDVDGLF